MDLFSLVPWTSPFRFLDSGSSLFITVSRAWDVFFRGKTFQASSIFPLAVVVGLMNKVTMGLPLGCPCLYHGRENVGV